MRAGLLFLSLLMICFAADAGPIRTVFIAPIGGGPNQQAFEQRLKEQMRRSGGVQLAGDAHAADAVLHCTAVIWPVGRIAMSTRSNSTTMTDYQGYVSAELASGAGQMLWSYLVTPSRFRMTNVVNDLADQLSSRLGEAIRHGFPDAAAAATGTGGAGVALRAAGATFPAPLYQRWFEAFRQQPGGFPIRYDAVGSVGGLEQLSQGKIDFAASDILPGAEGEATASGAMMPFATVVGGVVPIYNLPDGGVPLRFTPELLASIYAGSIRRWNDPQLRALNPHAHLPDTEIATAHRLDGSGTTFVWTSFLAQASPEWKGKAGASIPWPVGTGAQGNEGVADYVAKTPASIGYVELTYAIQHQLRYAAVRNPAGQFVRADLAGLIAAAHASHEGQETRSAILNSPARDAYPIAAFTWLLVPKAGGDPQKSTAIAGFLRWMLTAGQAECSALGYAPLPRDVAAEELRQAQALH